MAGEPLEVYSAKGFAALKELLQLVREDGFRTSDSARNTLPAATVQFLEERGFFRVWENVLQNTPDNAAARTQAFHRWFDALKTLQFIRFFRNG